MDPTAAKNRRPGSPGHGFGASAALAAVLGLTACQGAPTTPTQPTGRGNAAPLEVVCSTDGPVTCSARRFGEGDLTGVVQWLASSTNSVQEPEPSVSFSSPGVPVPNRWTQVYIAARLGSEVDASSFAYEMAPGARPILLAPIVGYVYEGETGLAGLSGVTVEIIDGEGNKGLSRTTNLNGFYQMFHVRVGLTFTMRASKPGYVPALASHPGIQIHPMGFPNVESSFQHFRLTKLP